MTIDDYVRMVMGGNTKLARRGLLNNVPYHWRDKVKARVITQFDKKKRNSN